MMMDSSMSIPGFGLFHLLLFVVMVAIVLYPLGRILNRIGFSPFWSLLAFVPVLNLVALWVLAFSEWPRNKAMKPTND